MSVNSLQISIPSETQDTGHDVINLRQYLILELRSVRHKSIKRSYSSHRGVKILEQLVRDACRDLRAVAPRLDVFINHQHLTRFLNRARDRLPIVRSQTAKVDHFDADSLLFFEFLRRY